MRRSQINMMEFCPDCGNMLIPKGKKLYCKTCKRNYYFKSKKDYFLEKTINHDETELSPVIIENPSDDHISVEEREAYEDFFGTEG
jgi:DNA-directed RNA polymerase subunit M/transcription elongation factor TFIIS